MKTNCLPGSASVRKGDREQALRSSLDFFIAPEQWINCRPTWLLCSVKSDRWEAIMTRLSISAGQPGRCTEAESAGANDQRWSHAFVVAYHRCGAGALLQHGTGWWCQTAHTMCAASSQPRARPRFVNTLIGIVQGWVHEPLERMNLAP